MLGDPDKAFQEAEAVSEGTYGIPVVTHCCLETHGAVIQWQGDTGQAWPSTQDVTTWASQLSPNIKVPATNIKVKMDYIGGGFGSKFGPDAWGEVAARLSQKAGGRPVKLFLDRATEQKIAGNRPSAFAKIKIGGKKDGTITVWQAKSWATGGFTGGGSPPLALRLRTGLPNYRLQPHPGLDQRRAASRAWRAPNNQQASYLTCCAVEDFAAKIGMDPIEVFKKNVEYAPKARVDLYTYQLDKAAELADWKKLWHPRGPERRGTGEARPGPRLQRLGRRGAQQPVPHHHQSGWLGAGGDRHPGPGHRHPHHHHPGGGGNARPADGPRSSWPSAPTNCRPTPLPAVPPPWAAFRFPRRKVQHERAGQAVRSGGARAWARNPTSWKPWTATSA